jgi:hypothetical protein
MRLTPYMHSQLTDGARLRNALLLTCALLLLTACPGDRTAGGAGKVGQTTNSAKTTATETGEYPQDALDYLAAALQDPAREGKTTPLAITWSVIAQLDKLAEAPGGAAVRAEVGSDVEQFEGRPPVELVAAWLNCAPEPAREFIVERARQGDWSYIDALWFQPELARELLADKATRLVPDSGVSATLAQRWLSLQAFWGRVTERDGDLLGVISNLPNVPRDSLRATGWLLRLQPERKEYIEYLTLGLVKAVPGKYAPLEGAAEGIKLSRHEAFAELLVPIAATVVLSDTKFVGKLAKLKDMQEANAQQLYMAYAVTYLPGEQAKLMRTKLLKAKDARIAWQARLGELLHGNPAPWDAAITKDGFKTNDWWVALQALDSPEPALLPTYRRMAESGDASVKLRALAQLGRFRQYAGNAEVAEIITMLTKDEVPEVRATAWYAAGKVGIGEPRAAFEDSKQTPEVRMAAAFALLMGAQAGPPDLRGWEFVSISGDNSKGGDGPSPSAAAEGSKDGDAPSPPLTESKDSGQRPPLPKTKEGGQ